MGRQSTLTLSSAQQHKVRECLTPGTLLTLIPALCVCVHIHTERERDNRFKARTVYTSICLNANGLPVLQQPELKLSSSSRFMFPSLNVHIVNASCLEWYRRYSTATSLRVR
ncbi:hypothetical protein E3U43_001852 [Larimichthys crocea]|uniref:Uncharacterized protein n=1 Tax=Larimichthys crocea TaxID=215358 RepID=A0ACD3RGM8_LARCR|nr:hypothetical protein E3U43_001852 [Larimichthys crocea]